MNSQIFLGETVHTRLSPREHQFRYPMFWLSIDLEEIDAIDRRMNLFGHNRRALISIFDQDYGVEGNGSILEKLELVLRKSGIHEKPRSVRLLTIPRVAGYVFGPVSFYLCGSEPGVVDVLVAEVRNTFGEKHMYCCRRAQVDARGVCTFEFQKEFYVSPFFPVNGSYRIQVRDRGHLQSLIVDLNRDGEIVFAASMIGRGSPLTNARLRQVLCRLPFFAASIMGRIHWQALRLYVQKRLPMYKKPEPANASTIAARGWRFWYVVRAALVQRARKG